MIVEKKNWDLKQRIIVHSSFNIIETLMPLLETEYQQELFSRGPFSHLQHLKGHVYPKKLAHLLVLSQVESGNVDELHFNVCGNILVFNIYDFELISGKCQTYVLAENIKNYL